MKKSGTIKKFTNKYFLPAFFADIKNKGGGGVFGGNKVTLFTEGDEFFDTVIKEIDNAKKSINLETYIFNSDNVGWIIASKLAKKSAQGVEVNLIYDAVGCIATSRDMFRTMEESGVEIIEYNPFAPWRKYWKISFRDHRKIIVIDGKKAFVGGINIGAEYAGEKYNGGGWRDTHVLIEGPSVRDVQFFFMENWFRNGGEVLQTNLYFPNLKKRGSKLLMILCARSRNKGKPVKESYVSAINNARKSIFITNAYFIPDARIHKALVRAASKGVDVVLLLPGKTDIPIVRYASRYLYKLYLKNGLKIYEYQESILHAKTAVIDGIWSTVGSSNLDRRSFRKNLEVNAVVLDQDFGEIMEKVFEDDLAKSIEVTLENFGKRSFIEFFLEWFAYRFRNIF